MKNPSLYLSKRFDEDVDQGHAKFHFAALRAPAGLGEPLQKPVEPTEVAEPVDQVHQPPARLPGIRRLSERRLCGLRGGAAAPAPAAVLTVLLLCLLLLLLLLH